MPQAYSVATGPAEANTRSPVAVSCTRGAGPLPGSTGTSARRHESMSVRLSRGSLGPGRTGTGSPPCGGQEERGDRQPPGRGQEGGGGGPPPGRGAGGKGGGGQPPARGPGGNGGQAAPRAGARGE